ncbi:hypothetical protein QFZ22_000140 [Streptomyces canus]|uniref:Uncharacterized protein n=1 Tax=Streptomyces canus TaxID=58343 RepID=A0AAW8F473_9ACTN|nr:hypothetical protein [Streptomyces canus]MDQ0904155.1 hypothetical protein [Streptomyces canus]
MTSSTTTVARTIGANVLDSVSVIGGVVVGTAVGRLAHARTTDRNGSASRLAAGVAAGLAAAVITDSLLNTATSSWRSVLNGSASGAPAATFDQARPRIAAQAAADAAHKAKSRWYWSDLRSPAASDALWHGYEDGTATYYLAPGLYLRYQPDHRDLGIKRSVGWTEQYSLETGEGTTVLTGPAHLLELLDSLQEEATTTAVVAGERSELLAAIVDAALAEQPEDDLTCVSVTGEVIQERAAEFGMVEVTHTEAVDLINERLYQRRVRLASGSAADEDLDASVADPGSTAVTSPAV